MNTTFGEQIPFRGVPHAHTNTDTGFPNRKHFPFFTLKTRINALRHRHANTHTQNLSGGLELNQTVFRGTSSPTTHTEAKTPTNTLLSERRKRRKPTPRRSTIRCREKKTRKKKRVLKNLGEKKRKNMLEMEEDTQPLGKRWSTKGTV